MGFKAITKIQSAALTSIIVVAAVGGGSAYVLWSWQAKSGEAIGIGFCGDTDSYYGKDILQASMLAVEQVNAEGGVLGRNFTVVAEDDDSDTTGDLSVATNALTKLITVDKADFVIAQAGLMGLLGLSFQDVCAEHEKILVSVQANFNELSQRVLDNYDKYKYYFSMMPNETSQHDGFLDSILTLRNYTGFNKIAYIDQDESTWAQLRTKLLASLSDNGFDIVYQNSATWMTTDFTSYFAAIEASGAEILATNMVGAQCYSFVKEWCDRQSPFALWGLIGQANRDDFWELTEGKCEYVSFVGFPAMAGYPLTNRTIPFRDAYLQRWNGEIPTMSGTLTYDFVRFILPEALKRAGTTETEAVIKALEKTDVETSTASHFVFTSSHGVMMGENPNNPDTDYMLAFMFQWQNGTQVPVIPEEIMKEAGATYKYPPWQGPWSNSQTP